MSISVIDRPKSEQLFTVDQPTVIDQLEVDGQLRAKATELIGSVVIDSSVEVQLCNETRMTLAEASKRAANGDDEALQMVRANANTDYFERAYKSGHISKITLQKDDLGLSQYGQRLVDTHLNSIKYLHSPLLKHRARVEAVNGVRNEFLAQNGLLKDNISVTFSLVTKKVDEEAASKLGFFTDTMSIAVQIMTEDDDRNGDGDIVIETAFVAGRESAVEERRDEEIIIHLLADLGIDFSMYDADEMLAHPVLIPKSVINNSSELLERFDRSVQAMTNKKTFYGRVSNEPKDYKRYAEECRRREAVLQQEVEATVQSLLASSSTFKNPTDATSMLDRLNDTLLKKRIVSDTTIDANVLGQQAAYYVNHARYLVEHNQYENQIRFLQTKIEREGRSSSCPGGGAKSEESFLPWESMFSDSDQKEAQNEGILEDCDFISKECPNCHAKNVKTQCRKGVYYGDCGCSSK
jgi:hypothetical protein